MLNDYIRQSTGKTNKYLPPPFVVLACQQSILRLSREQGFAIRVVAGESDDFCVRMAREDDSAVIVSADGDFLIFVGETGQFAPLQKFPAYLEDTITFSVYMKIRQGLGIARANGMVEVAALLRKDGSMTVAQCITCVNRNETLQHVSQETLGEFVETYMAIEKSTPRAEIQEVLDCGVLFGRLTELFFSEEPTMWLPLLPLSSPPRRTPWEISRPIRQRAYYELRKGGFIQGDAVMEIIQRGQRVAKERVSIENEDVVSICPDKEQVFVTAMTILLDNVSEVELDFLPHFVGMFVLLQESPPQLSFADVPAPLQYITLQYQTIIYSLIMVLQAQSPLSTAIPEFATLWDLPRFRMAVTKTVKEGKFLWLKITTQRDSSIQDLYNTDPSSRRRKIKIPKSDNVKSRIQGDQGNRFSSLAM